MGAAYGVHKYPGGGCDQCGVGNSCKLHSLSKKAEGCLGYCCGRDNTVLSTRDIGVSKRDILCASWTIQSREAITAPCDKCHKAQRLGGGVGAWRKPAQRGLPGGPSNRAGKSPNCMDSNPTSLLSSSVSLSKLVTSLCLRFCNGVG